VCEIIIVDDKSTDNTEEVVENLKKDYPIIVYFKSKIKIRQTGAKNIGISIAKGDYCYFGDDDSVLKEGSIKSLVNSSKKYPNSIIAARHIYMKEYENLKHVLIEKDLLNQNSALGTTHFWTNSLDQNADKVIAELWGQGPESFNYRGLWV
jgi:glycosyltransferase involved in cell wall biosynthesis